MKIIITKENLIKSLQKVIGVVEKRQTMPILSHVLFRKNNNTFEVVASDLEVQLSSSISLEDGSDFTDDVTIPGRKLFDIGKGLPDESVLEINLGEESKIQIKSKKSKFILSALDARTFPIMDTADEGSIPFSFKSKNFKDIIGKTSFAMAQQDVRYYLNGLFLNISQEEIFGVATDGHRLAKAGAVVKTGISLSSANAIIPRKGIIEIDKQLVDEDEIKAVLSKNHLQITNNNSQAITKLIDGKFPDYTRVIPSDTDKIVMVDCKSFKEALIRVSILSNDRFRGVRLNFLENEIGVSANNPEKEEASDDIKSTYSGEPLEVGFNVNYLIDVLNVIKTKNVQISLKDANSSALLMPENDSSSSYVVMPLRL
ncbi:DNA polymerase III subunit beta [Gammaproteobacteria bacterium]|nr:DNA polymerase III subunit beta [Gammaproteobacteria bacterium]